MQKRWPIALALIAVAALWITYALIHPFHPNYKNYNVTSAPTKGSGNAQGS